MENIDELKLSTLGYPTYKLRNADVFVSDGGLHYLKTLDPIDSLPAEVDQKSLTNETEYYIDKQLQHSRERFEKQVKVITDFVGDVDNLRILDIGSGGGLFLSLLQEKGAITKGIELSDPRIIYARTKYKLDIVKTPIEDSYWDDFKNHFDVVTMWDVIEHVNFPNAILRRSLELLKPGGLIAIDTPCRDSFYHRFGELSYRLSRGRFPTFLNSMYSSNVFAHKQIFSTNEMSHMMIHAGMIDIRVGKFHELSFPYLFYLKKILRSDLVAKLMLPSVHAFLYVFPIKNKMLAVARKPADHATDAI